jgi:hypothetical protein
MGERAAVWLYAVLALVNFAVQDWPLSRNHQQPTNKRRKCYHPEWKRDASAYWQSWRESWWRDIRIRQMICSLAAK